MKRVILDPKTEDSVLESKVHGSQPMFVKRDGKLWGMIVCETRGWITRMGGSCGATGHHVTRCGCIASLDTLTGEYDVFIP